MVEYEALVFEVVYQWGRYGLGSIRAGPSPPTPGSRCETRRGVVRASASRPTSRAATRIPLEPTLQSFNPLFPKGAYFGENQLLGPFNHIDLHPSVDLHSFRQVTVSPSWLFFWRQNKNGGVYGVPGNLMRPVRGATSRYVGSQPAVMLTVGLGRHLTVAMDFEYFITGPFLRESGPANNMTYFGSWVTFVF